MREGLGGGGLQVWDGRVVSEMELNNNYSSQYLANNTKNTFSILRHVKLFYLFSFLRVIFLSAVEDFFMSKLPKTFLGLNFGGIKLANASLQ